MSTYFKYGNDTSYDLEDEEYAMLMDGSVFGLGRWPECGLEKDVKRHGANYDLEENARLVERYRKDKED